MNPSIALLLCFAFVLVLLRLESRTSPDNSWAVWIPTAWMLIVASRPLIEWFVPVTAKGVTLDNDAGSIIDRWFLIALASAAILVLISRRFRRWDSLWRLKWLFVLLAYMFVSTLWSDITLIAMRRWTRELIVPIVAMVILSEVNPLRALEAVFRRTAYVLLPFSILLIKYYPLLGRVYGRYSGAQMWVGVGQQKNQLGRLCAISALFLGFALYQYWRRHQKPRDFRNRAWADAGYASSYPVFADRIGVFHLACIAFPGRRCFHSRLLVPEVATYDPPIGPLDRDCLVDSPRDCYALHRRH